MCYYIKRIIYYICYIKEISYFFLKMEIINISLHAYNDKD